MKGKNDRIIKSAGGIVIRKDKNIWKVALLFKNQTWVFPKGRIKTAETEKKAALREIHEELRIPLNRLEVIGRLGRLYYIDRSPVEDYFPRPKVVTYFLVKTNYKKIQPLKIDNFQNAYWFSLEKGLEKLNFLENKAILFKAIKEIERIEKKYQKIDTIIIPVGGEGKRMGINNKFKQPKLLVKIHGQPFIKFLLDNAIKSGFRKIYLLTGHYQKEIEEFVKKNYKNRKIKMIDGGINGILPAVEKVKNYIKSPFIYHDGNVISHSKLLKDLHSSESLKESMIKFAVSQKDRAPTHLQVRIQHHKIKETFPRINYYQTNINKKDDIFYSMGIMAVDNRVFRIFPQLKKFNDWDIFIDYLFKTKLNTTIEFVSFFKDDEWYCIHTKKDIELIEQNGKRFFSSLIT